MYTTLYKDENGFCDIDFREGRILVLVLDAQNALNTQNPIGDFNVRWSIFWKSSTKNIIIIYFWLNQTT